MNADKRGYLWESVDSCFVSDMATIALSTLPIALLVALSSFICVHLRFSDFRVVNGYRSEYQRQFE